MKKNLLLFAFAFSASSVFAQIPSKDISSILEEQRGLDFNLEFIGESAVSGAVGDFNNDGIDDFVVNGLHKVGEHKDGDKVIADLQSFLYVYLGQRNATPILAYKNDNFEIGGNGSTDCAKNEDGSWMIAVQGGSNGNWANPFTAKTYKLTVTGEQGELEEIIDLDNGAGRGSIRFLNINDDNHIDVFQNGWKANATWGDQANVYRNDGTDFFEIVSDHGIRNASNTFTEVADIDGDGKLDILFPIQGTGLFAYFNNGDGTFREVLVTPFPKAERTDGINFRKEDDSSEAALIDIDNDGKLEVILSGTNDGTGGDWAFVLKLYKYENEQFVEIPATNKAGESITWLGGQRADFAVADFDRDGNQDFILGVENQNSALAWGCRTYFFSGNGKGGFDQAECTYADDNVTGIAPMSRRANFGCFLVGDFNGDGKSDLVQAGTTYYAKFGAIRYYANVSQGTSIKNETMSNISVYASGKTLCVKGATGAEIKVSNLSGMICKTAKAAKNDMILLLELNAGIYLVEVVTRDGATTQKVVIK